MYLIRHAKQLMAAALRTANKRRAQLALYKIDVSKPVVGLVKTSKGQKLVPSSPLRGITE
jgi:hypothetical protein